ncbi:hypothetical protein MRX96_024375 [Rhipicephalus microplus]
MAGRNGRTSMSSSDVRGVPVEPGPPDLAPPGALRLSRHPGGATGGTGGAVAVGSGAGPRGVHHLGTLQRTGGRGGRGGERHRSRQNWFAPHPLLPQQAVWRQIGLQEATQGGGGGTKSDSRRELAHAAAGQVQRDHCAVGGTPQPLAAAVNPPYTH